MPKAEIHIILGNKNYFAKHLIENYVKKVFHYDKKLINSIKLIFQLRNEKYDYIIDLFDNYSRTSELFIKFINAKQSVGLNKINPKGQKVNYDITLDLLAKDKYHIIDRIAELTKPFFNNINIDNNDNEAIENIDLTSLDLTSLDLTSRDFSPEYNFKTYYNVDNYFAANPSNKTIFINLFGSSKEKFWGIENNIELIKNILLNQKQNFNIILSTTKDRFDYLNNIIDGISKTLNMSEYENRFFVMDYNPDLDYVANVISRCDLVITPDTAIVHIASCFKVKTIILYQDNEKDYGGKYWTPYKTECFTLSSDDRNITNISLERLISFINNIFH